MKKYFVLLLVALVPFYASARSNFNRSRKSAIQDENYHFGYVTLSGGYTSLSQTVSDVSTRGNWGYLVGAGYEFRRNSFWLSVGAQLMQEQSCTKANYQYRTPLTFSGIDDQNKKVKFFQYDIRQEDYQSWRTVDVPIMLGYYNSGFYVGAGAKVAFALNSSITTKGTYDLGGMYEQYIDMFEHVNYYTNYPADEVKFDCHLRPQFSLIGEIGYDVLSPIMSNKPICHVLKVGFYFEYGLNKAMAEGKMDPIAIKGMTMEQAARAEMTKQADVRYVTLNPYYLSENTGSKRVVPYYVGLKLTYMFGGSRNATGTWHKGCQCYK